MTTLPDGWTKMRPITGVLKPRIAPDDIRDALPQMYADFFDAWEALHAPSAGDLSAEQIRTRKEMAAQHLVGIAHMIRRARNGG